MVGIPGSGKSTWVRKITGDVAVCSTDDYCTGADGVYRFDPSKLGKAHGVCLLPYEEVLRFGACDAIVVDNTNTTTEEIAPYMALALAHGASVEVVVVHCRPEIAASRNTHGVPLAACRAMRDRLASLRLPPFWNCEVLTVDGEEKNT
jgi:predicted kinase